MAVDPHGLFGTTSGAQGNGGGRMIVPSGDPATTSPQDRPIASHAGLMNNGKGYLTC